MKEVNEKEILYLKETVVALQNEPVENELMTALAQRAL
jgi:hypothetical protein